MHLGHDIEHLIEAATPLIARLCKIRRARLSALVGSFVAETDIEGAGGFQVTPEVKLTIAAQACLLLINRPQNTFGPLRITVYEHTIDDAPSLMGRYSRGGDMVLNWADLDRGGYLARDGCNVVMHEFAHYLDGENLFMDGVPALHSLSCHLKWRRDMAAEYGAFKADVAAGQFTRLNPYGATHPAEFFACATEALFEQPDMLRVHYPRVYDRLAHFYGHAP